MKTNSLICILAVTISSMAFAHDMGAGSKMPKDFERVKQLVGHWEGTAKMEGKDTPVTADYELTSGGTAVLERSNAGTPHEMVSVYHAEGNAVAMTHYCALGNHPTMVLKKSDAKSLSFEMAKAEGVKSMKEAHMHAVDIVWNSPTEIQENWTSFENGKKAQTHSFTMTKK